MINIAIDGPAGAGKSTVAKAVANKLGLIYLDTGAMYRATAYYALSKGVDVSDESAVKPLLDGMNMEIVYEDGAQQIYVNDVNVTPYLRQHYMSKAASDISALPSVRYKMVELQRNFAASRDVALDGRDIGTFVLPDANFKFFMTATPEERAKRRFLELEQKGQNVNYEDILKDIIQRDYNDSHREVAPLKQADDAIYLDTTNMGVDAVVDFVTSVVTGNIEGDDKPSVYSDVFSSSAENMFDETDTGNDAVSDADDARTEEMVRATDDVAHATDEGDDNKSDGTLNGADSEGEDRSEKADTSSDDKTECANSGKSGDVNVSNQNTDGSDASGQRALVTTCAKEIDKNAERFKKYYQLPKSYGLYKFLRVLLKPVQALFFPVEIINLDYAKNVDGRAIYICNHYSKIDTFAMYFNIFKGEAHTLAKAELFQSPLPAWFLHSMGAIPVKRGEPDIDSAKAVLKLLKDDRKLLIFPEGTRNKEGTKVMGELKGGTARYALKTKSPIVPMMYYEKPRAFKKSYLYVGEPFTLQQFYDLNAKDGVAQATEYIGQRLNELREKVNAYVAEKGSAKKKK